MKSLVATPAVALFVCGSALAAEIRPCDSFYFPAEVPPELRDDGAYDEDCFGYVSDDARHIVVYPSWWGESPGSTQMEILDDSLEALVQSRKTLSSYGPLDRDLILVISEIFDERALAVAQSPSATRSCWSMAYRQAYSESSEYYKQTVAHEVAHCFFNEAVYTSASRSGRADDWWNEGGAEYFSGVVYPAADAEHLFAAAYDTGAALIAHDYETVLFFQNYANKNGGPGGVLALMRAVRGAGGAARTRQILSSRSGFDDVFHDFGKEIIAGAVGDPGGGSFPDPQQSNFVTKTYDGDQGGLRDKFETRPLLVTPIQIDVEPGYDYRLSAPEIPEGARMQISYAEDDGRPLKPYAGEITLEGDCEEVKSYIFVVTSVDASEDTRRAEFEVEPEGKPLEECPCESDMAKLDQCMIGTWRFDKQSLQHLLDVIAVHSGFGSVPLDGMESDEDVTVSWRMEMFEDVVTIFEPKNFRGAGQVRSTMDWRFKEGPPYRGSALITRQSSVQGEVCTDRENHKVKFTVLSDQSTDMGSYMEFDGDRMAFPAPPVESAGGFDTGFMGYQCTSDTLVLTGEYQGAPIEAFLSRATP